MAKLKVTVIPDDKPVKLTLELPAVVHRDLIAYAEILSRGGQKAEPSKLAALMLQRFIATDRGFTKMRRSLVKSDVETQAAPGFERREG